MNENKKSETLHRPYAKPEVRSLNMAAKGRGVSCNNGSADVICYSGVTAGSGASCIAGDHVAVSACNSGTVVTPYCNTGTDGYIT